MWVTAIYLKASWFHRKLLDSIGLDGAVLQETSALFPTWRFHFAVAVIERGARIQLAVHYNVYLFDLDEIRLFGDCYLNIVKAILKNSHEKVEYFENMWNNKNLAITHP